MALRHRRTSQSVSSLPPASPSSAATPDLLLRPRLSSPSAPSASSPSASSTSSSSAAAPAAAAAEEVEEAAGLLLFSRLELVGALLRLAALLLGALQDARWPALPYTDADFFVVGEGAALLLSGRSPFARATFRYSPLLALLVAPGEVSWPALALALPQALGGGGDGGVVGGGTPPPFRPLALWGKLLFCACDLAVGRLVLAVLRARGLGARSAAWAAAAFLLSPLAINVSSRGSADSLVCALVLLTLLLLLRRRERAAAAAFGAAVHMRLFPVIFALPLVLFLDEHSALPGESETEAEVEGKAESEAEGKAWRAGRRAGPAPTSPGLAQCALHELRVMLSWRRVRFGLLSLATFGALGFASFLLCGGDPAFVQEAFLFHLTRADTRHNFSALFYGLYLRSGGGGGGGGDGGSGGGGGDGGGAAAAAAAGLAAFLPQFSAVLALGTLLRRDLPLCLLAQTLAFVAFNKVVTAQYFCWWLALLPLVLPQSAMGAREAAALAALWAAAELHWLAWAFQLEHGGRAAFRGVWAAGLLFLAANCAVLWRILRRHRFVPVFERGRLLSIAGRGGVKPGSR